MARESGQYRRPSQTPVRRLPAVRFQLPAGTAPRMNATPVICHRCLTDQTMPSAWAAVALIRKLRKTAKASGTAAKLRRAPIFVSANAVPSGKAAVAKKSDTVNPNRGGDTHHK